MSRLLAYLAVFVAAATPWIEVLLVVPAGVIGGLGAVPTVVVAAAGNIATLVPVVLLGERLHARIVRRRTRRRPTLAVPAGAAEDGGDGTGRRRAPSGRARRLLERYGVPGLALLGPLVTGAHAAALVAVGSGAAPRRTLLWLSAGVAVWAVVAAGLTLLGAEVVLGGGSPPDLPGL